MKRNLVAALLLISEAFACCAITPLWLRDVKISPNGKEVAFTYKGDIYKVSTQGGPATRLTSSDAYESGPIWSPDGTKIAYMSDKFGGGDIFLISSNGGVATRITSNSAIETPETFSIDGKNIIFSAAIQAPTKSSAFPTGVLRQLYSVGIDGKNLKQILGTPALNIDYFKDGKSFVYQDVKGFEDTWRKHHTSSVTRDIWLKDSKGRHTNLTNREGEDLNPVLSPDQKSIYFLSERNGESMNVYKLDLDKNKELKKITDFKTHPVRFLSASNNGELAYSYDGEIYIQPSESATPQKLFIDIVNDVDESPRQIKVSSASESTISPDGKQLAFVYRGEVFVTSTEYSSTKQITNTAENESDIVWGKDSRELYYTSLRDGHFNIYKATIARKDDPNFSNATLINETPLFKSDKIDRTYPSLSPDGKKLAYIEDRNKLMVMDLKDKSVKQLTDGSTWARRTKGFKANWSPDSKYIAIDYIEPKHDPYGDIAVVEVATGKLTKITETGYFDENPKWVMDGKALLFLSERYGMRNHASWGSEYDVMLTFLDKDAFDKYRLSEEDYALLKEAEKANKKKADAKKDSSTDKKDDKSKNKDNNKSKVSDKNNSEKIAPEKKDSIVNLDLNNLEYRTVRLTPSSADICDAIISKDGQTLYYLASFEDGYDLWEVDLRKKDAKIANKLNGSSMSIELDKDGNLYLLGRQAKKYDPKSKKMKSISISTSMDLDAAKERDFLMNYVDREVRERFFRKDMNGCDWDGMVKAYSKFLPHINNNYDYAEMLSELLGELNVSHTGGRYSSPSAKNPTASLGLLYDVNYTGAGLKVDEILPNGPFDVANSTMVRGSIINKINGKDLSFENDPLSVLNGLNNKKTLIEFTTPNGKTHEMVVLPINGSKFNNLMYERWVKNQQAAVDKLSNGRLGYVHIQSMDDASFRRIYADLLGKYIDKEGIVIDTRWNGGGRLHEDIEVLFSGKAYLTQEVHGQETSQMPSRRWNKPSIMIIGEANYSNAHGTPWVYKHLNLGKLVGMPVPGTMSSVNWVRTQDPTLVFGVPVVGFRTAEGTYLENQQLEPDIKVVNTPESIVKGDDLQLKAAVESLLNQIDEK